MIALARVHAQRSFPKKHDFHLRAEPIAPYDTSLWSSTYDRGHDLELTDLQEYYQLNPDPYLEDGIRRDLYINIIFNKIQLPKFCAGSFTVTLVIDGIRSLDWAQRSLWHKHFIELDDKIIYCPNHPLYCPEASIPTVSRYQNQCEFDIDQKSQLMERYIYQNPAWQQFTDIAKSNDDSNYFLPISALFNLDQLVQHFTNIAQILNWSDFDCQILSTVQKSWMDSQLSY